MEPERELVDGVVQKLVRIGRRLWERGFVEATSGNLSVKVKDAPVRIVITATGIDKASLSPADFLIVDGSGEPVDGASKKPSHETRLHVKVYAVVPGAGAVIHTHSPHAVALSRVVKKNAVSFRGLELAKAFWGVQDIDDQALKMPVVENDKDIDKMATTALAQRKWAVPAVAFAGHGVCAWGRDPDEALRHAEAVEALCRVLVLERAMD